MFIRPNEDTTTALARIGKSAEWEVLEAWFRASREALVQQSFSPDDIICRQAQGGVKVLDELIRLTRAAVESATSR